MEQAESQGDREQEIRLESSAFQPDFLLHGYVTARCGERSICTTKSLQERKTQAYPACDIPGII